MTMPKKIHKKCDRCPEYFYGNANSKYCPSCIVDVRSENKQKYAKRKKMI